MKNLIFALIPRGVELLDDRFYTIGVRMAYTSCNFPMETVWGGHGDEEVMADDGRGTKFFFARSTRANVRSSVNSGQIPIIYFI